MIRPISPPTTASSGSLSSSKRGPRDYGPAPTRSASRMTTRTVKEADDHYADRAAPAVESAHANEPSRRMSMRRSESQIPLPVDNEADDVNEPTSGVYAKGADAGAGEGSGEKVIQMLCDFESGFHLLLDRIKQDMHSTKEAVTFLRKRATIEEEYGKAMLRLGQSGLSTTGKAEGKEGTYGTSWAQFTKVHEQVGDIRVKFAATITELAEELSTLHKNTERSRKQLKEAGHKHSKTVQEAEAALEKSKTRYEQTSEEWERSILQREQQAERDGFARYGAILGGGSGSGMTMPKSMSSRSGLSTKGISGTMSRWKGVTPAKLQKAEDDARTKAAVANSTYKHQLAQTNLIRTTYFQTHLPRFIRLLKATNDECDQGLQYHLLGYTQALEAALMKEATTMSPIDGSAVGVLKIIEGIDNDRDFEEFAEAYVRENPGGGNSVKSEDIPFAGSRADPAAAHNLKPSFGVDLQTLMERDSTPVPHVVTQCIGFVERHGMRTQGVYRVSGLTQQVQRIRAVLDRDAENVNLEEHANEIHAVCGVFKLYFRELPDPLFPRSMYTSLLDAARIEDERLRLITIHELINQLHDSNYATLQVLAGHLYRVAQNESETRMSATNLSIVWGPTLLDSPDFSAISADPSSSTSPPMPDPMDIKLQTRIVETVIANFLHIFDTSEE
ncbi:Rho GTPase activation protein [Fimicolochytrium jonesii]|uniref:Rho GTPase activation protein n=1 Tax=Fimicolochytrium jonesii TaxID=1396493 RepID=UPI0022FDD2C0|nr:Rho GTPase activation protein [Fimicolochytrium jonesii]KAI8827278.1 Rho GTPase activation protein [Fimicolochytrium jonesii]